MTMEDVRELRSKTGAGIVDCQKALKEAGSLELAIEVLRKKGLSKAAKKEGRVAAEGIVYSTISNDLKSFAILELKCETDFVARTDDFKGAIKLLAEKAIEYKSKDREEFLGKDIDGSTIENHVKELVAKFGENTLLGRVSTGNTNGFYESYSHSNDKLSVVVEIEGENNEQNRAKAKDVAMHIAAMSPAFLDETSVDKSVVDKEREIYRAELVSSGKPEGVIDRIVDGKIAKYYEASCLLNQKFVKDPSLTVAQYLKDIKVLSFLRFKLGE